jgi:hypothetical protein
MSFSPGITLCAKLISPVRAAIAAILGIFSPCVPLLYDDITEAA